MNLISKIKNYYSRAYKKRHFPSFGNFLFRKKKIFIYYGFLGDGNLGDELVYEATREIFSSYHLLPIHRHMPVLLKLYTFFFWRKFSGVILGGGTMITDIPPLSKYFVRLMGLNKPVFIHGSGVFEQIKGKDFWDKLFNCSFYGGVRGPLSQKNIKNNFRIDVPILGDAAFYLFENTISTRNHKIEKEKIIVNFGTHSYFPECEKDRIQIIKFIENKISEGLEILFIPFHEIDLSLGEKLKKQIPEIVLLDIPKNNKQIVNIFNKCIFAIGERLHFGIVSIMAGCPLLSINYSNKHVDFLKSVDIDFAGVTMGNITYRQIEEFFDNRNDLFNWELVANRLEEYKLIQQRERNRFIRKINNLSNKY